MGKGIYTNVELIESLILDLNNLPKELVDGQFIQFCTLVSQMGQKLANLRNGVQNDIDSKNKVIEQLKEQLRNAGAEVADYTPQEFLDKMKKDGAE